MNPAGLSDRIRQFPARVDLTPRPRHITPSVGFSLSYSLLVKPKSKCLDVAGPSLLLRSQQQLWSIDLQPGSTAQQVSGSISCCCEQLHAQDLWEIFIIILLLLLLNYVFTVIHLLWTVEHMLIPPKQTWSCSLEPGAAKLSSS